MIIAVDFDGTIVEHEYPKIGKPIPFAIETLLQLQKEGHTLLLWSVREGDLLQEAIDYCANKGLVFYAANKNHPDEEPQNTSRKLNADIFIDDRNVGGLPDWGIIYNLIYDNDFSGNSLQTMMEEDRHYPRRKKNFFIRLGEMFEKGY